MRFLVLLFLLFLGACVPSSRGDVLEGNIPEEAYHTLEYINLYHKPPKGFVGGRRFGNYEKRLPLKDENGKRIYYQEWDIFPKKKGQNRGPHRIVTGSNSQAWYTADHYETFKLMK